MSRLLTILPAPESAVLGSSRFTRVDVAVLAGVEVRSGDQVAVDGFDGGDWVFQNLVTNVHSGESWVDVQGGVNGHRDARSFAVERVTVA